MHKVICNVQCKHALPNVEFLCYDYTLASVRKCYELLFLIATSEMFNKLAHVYNRF